MRSHWKLCPGPQSHKNSKQHSKRYRANTTTANSKPSAAKQTTQQPQLAPPQPALQHPRNHLTSAQTRQLAQCSHPHPCPGRGDRGVRVCWRCRSWTASAGPTCRRRLLGRLTGDWSSGSCGRVGCITGGGGTGIGIVVVDRSIVPLASLGRVISGVSKSSSTKGWINRHVSSSSVYV